MPAKLLIGVDIGTQGTKAALFTNDGKCLAQSFRASKLHRPKPGVVTEDPERQFQSVCETIRECVREARIEVADVAGIGIDGQMAGVIGVGKDGRAVTPYDSWLDTRCAPYIRQMKKLAGDEVLERTGCGPSFNHGPKILWWKHQRPRTFKRIAAFVQPGGYAVMRLCGLDAAKAFIDQTYLHFSGFADNRNNCWESGLCSMFKLDEAKLPRIVPSHAVVGRLTAESASQCGLKAGVPLVAGCGDTAASFLACGATREGVCVDVAGTASVFAATTKHFRPDLKYQTLACGQSATPGLWHPYAYINGGGMNLEWFQREITQQGLSFDQLNQRASALVPDEAGPLFIPHLGGRVSPPQPNLRGAWVQLGWNCKLEHLYRAALEGVALEYAIYQKALNAAYPQLALRELRVTGGGEKSALWNSIKADVLQTVVRRITHGQGAPMGVAMLAGYGVGLLSDLPAAAERWIRPGETTRPRPAMAAHYQNRCKIYEGLLRQLDCTAAA